jgi:hypothetical protein
MSVKPEIPPLREFLTTEEVCAITNLGLTRIRQIAEMGYFPPCVGLRWQTMPTLTGLYRYAREQAQRSKSTLADAKLGKTDAERKLAELALKKALREVLPAKAVARSWSYLLQGVRVRWLQMPARAVLAFSLWADSRAAEAWLEKEVESILADLAENPDYSAGDDENFEDENESDREAEEATTDGEESHDATA